MKTKILILIIFLASVHFSKAQVRPHIGVSTAINTTILFDEGLNTDPQYISVRTYEMTPIGFSFGVDFSKKFGLQLESIMGQQEMIFEMVDAVKTSVGERKLDMSYLHLPLLMRFMGGGDKRARMNFNFGPQLSILNSGIENFDVTQPNAVLEIPEGAIDDLPEGTVDNGDGTYTMPGELPQEGFSTALLKKNADSQIESFKNKEFHLVGGLGLDIDFSKHLYLGMNVRADYSFTDMRNGELIEQIKRGSLTDIANNRSTLTLSAQISLNFMIGGTRSHNKKLMEQEGEADFR